MPISFKHEFIFFHIPRCSGTYLDSYYKFNKGNPLFGIKTIGNKKLTLPHLTYRDVRNKGFVSQEVLDSFFKFTIIRDPFPRMVSDYIWQKNHDLHGEFRHLGFSEYLDKAESIMAEQRYFEKIHYDHFRPMIEYCYCDGTCVMDKILILEDIENELSLISQRIKLFDLPRMNSSIYNLDEFRTKENIDRVYELYAEDKMLHDRLSAGL